MHCFPKLLSVYVFSVQCTLLMTRHFFFLFQEENIRLFPITIASKFVTLSWNTSSSSLLSTRNGYILQVRRQKRVFKLHGSAEEDSSFWTGNGVKRFEDIDVGLKSLSSYTVSGLAPGVDYVFELCLKRGDFVIVITSEVYRTKRQGFETAAGIQTDWATLLAVSLALSVIIMTCVSLSLVRWYRFQAWRFRIKGKRHRGTAGLQRGNGGRHETSSTKDMITSPSDHSSVAVLCSPTQAEAKGRGGDNIERNANSRPVLPAYSVWPNAESPAPSSATGDQSRLVDHEVSSPVD